jgi:septal ring factor EnvC (AmiA/AmiB activator)
VKGFFECSKRITTETTAKPTDSSDATIKESKEKLRQVLKQLKIVFKQVKKISKQLKKVQNHLKKVKILMLYFISLSL